MCLGPKQGLEVRVLGFVIGIVFFVEIAMFVCILFFGASRIEFCKILNSGLGEFSGELKCQSYIDFRFVSRYHELVNKRILTTRVSPIHLPHHLMRCLRED